MSVRTLVFISLAFTSGVLVDHLVMQEPARIRIQAGNSVGISSQASDMSDKVETMSAHPRLPPLADAGSGRNFKFSESNTHVQLLKLDAAMRVGRSPDIAAFKSEVEDKLFELIESSLPTFEGSSRNLNEDGSVLEFRKTEDGKDFFRHFDSTGSLQYEGWNDSTGEKLIRTFYQPTGLRSLGWTRGDGSITNVGFSQTGRFQSRSDQEADGTIINTNYDDLGRVHDVWRVRNGQEERIWP